MPWRPIAAALLAAAVLLAAASLAGCDSGGDGSAPPERGGQAAGDERSGGVLSYEGRVIRGWLLALGRQNYEEAAYYFAPGALIDQGVPYRLRSDSAARAFNASLPCRAKLVRLEDEGRRVLASFALRRGPGGPCSGIVRVRFTIRDGKFTVWRQLPSEDERPGETI